MKPRFTCAVLCLILATPRTSTQVLPFKTYSVTDGLIANDIEAIAQDGRGYMWFGTSDGISVFDGKTFTSFTTHDGLPHHFISQLLPDRKEQGTMWILAGGRLCRYSAGQFTTITLDAGLIHTVYQDAYGVIWCGTDRGAFVVDGNVITHVYPSVLTTDVFQIAEIGDSVMWFAGARVLTRLTRINGEAREITIALQEQDRFRSMLPDTEGNLWVTHGDGDALLVRGGECVARRPGYGEHPQSLRGYLYNAEGEDLWTFGYSGLCRMAKASLPSGPVIHYTTENGLPENTLRSVCIDREGNLWLGGRDHGVAKLASWNISRFPLGSVWFVHHHQFATSDPNNHLWVIAAETLTEFWKDNYGAWHRYKHTIARPDSLIMPDEGGGRKFSSIFCDHNGRLWVSTVTCPGIIECYEIVPDRSPGGDIHSRLKRTRTIPVDNPIPGRPAVIFAFLVSREGELWVSLSQVGIIRLSTVEQQPSVRLYDQPGLENYVRTLYEDRTGNIWAGTYNSGLYRLAAESLATSTFRRFLAGDGLPGYAFWDVRENRQGETLIGTSNGGLAVWNQRAVRVLDMQHGLPSNTVYSMTEDSLGRLWLATSIGMIYEDAPGSGRFLKKQPFIGTSALCCGTSRNGLLWFVTSTDLILYDYARDSRSKPFPPAYVTQLKVNGTPCDPGNATQLTYDQNSCEINFIGISFRDEEAIRYVYRLAGAETGWRGPTGNTSVTYAQLEPGSYKFEVKAITIDGTETAVPAFLAINIAPPFWRTNPFYGTVLLVCFSAIGLMYRRRVIKVRRREIERDAVTRRLIESQESERKRVAGELHDGLGQDLMVIINRARMAMKSPGSEVIGRHLQEMTETADHAIEQVREIAFNLRPYHLEQLGLAESVRSMVEKLALSSGIRFAVDTGRFAEVGDSDLALSLYRIVQECVNNVVKHSRATEAQIVLRYEGNRLEIAVRDNGQGFEGAPVGRALNTRGGFGLKGLAERVKLLGGTSAIDSAPGKGTCVTVIIPRPLRGAETHEQQGE
jgi:signal transduction histidine kinase/ligand-binding sensor domain-containing protein